MKPIQNINRRHPSQPTVALPALGTKCEECASTAAVGQPQLKRTGLFNIRQESWQGKSLLCWGIFGQTLFCSCSKPVSHTSSFAAPELKETGSTRSQENRSKPGYLVSSAAFTAETRSSSCDSWVLPPAIKTAGGASKAQRHGSCLAIGFFWSQGKHLGPRT